MKEKTLAITSILAASAALSLIADAQEKAVSEVVSSGVMTSLSATVTGQLKTRQHVVTIYAGPNGPLYTVIDQDGNVQGVQLSEALLAKHFPALKSILDNPPDSAILEIDQKSSPLEKLNF